MHRGRAVAPRDDQPGDVDAPTTSGSSERADRPRRPGRDRRPKELGRVVTSPGTGGSDQADRPGVGVEVTPIASARTVERLPALMPPAAPALSVEETFWLDAASPGS